MRDRDQLLPHRVQGTLSRVGKARIDRLSRQFRRNLNHPNNNNKGVCFDVLGVFQSFPGAEADELNTSRFFVDAQAAQQELVHWASTVVPTLKEQLDGSLAALQGASEDAPVNVASLRQMLESVSAGLDVHTHCPHLARTTVTPTAAQGDAMEA